MSAGPSTAHRTTLTAPALLGMRSPGAVAFAVALAVALVCSATADLHGVRHHGLFFAGLAAAGLGILGVLAVRTDPMPWRSTVLLASTGPVACLATCLAVPGPLHNADQMNALGAGVAICAFSGVRGRTAAAWTSFGVMSAIVVCWSLLTRQGWVGVAVVTPNAAVLGMSTLFAVFVRPIAVIIRRLNAASIADAEASAAAQARLTERDERRGELRRVAWPSIRRIASGDPLTVDEVRRIRATEAHLRDGVRARPLNVPEIAAAARGARLRGVEVTMLADGDFDAVPANLRAQFQTLAASWLGRVTVGALTVRIHPAGRDVLGSIVHQGPRGLAGAELRADGSLVDILVPQERCPQY